MYLTILTLPLLSSIACGFLGRKLGNYGVYFISSISLILALILSFIAFYEVGLCHTTVSLKLTDWIRSEFLSVPFGFIFDSLTVTIFLPILIVSAIVHVYSIGYIKEDPHQPRFFCYLSIFTFFILILVSADNFLLIFVGWEWIGIASYLLINFWFTRLNANKAAIQAIIFNRVGDYAFAIGLFAIYWVYGNVDCTTIFSLTPLIHPDLIVIISICLVIAAIAKSAQIGLHGWLPWAIEGPTPVSSLMHAATLVTAGIYLLIRSSPILEYGSTVLTFIIWVGSLTAFFAATSGFVQNDFKRVIAYSTCSQLGYMIFALGLSNYGVSLFHLVNHAFFKALLFLAAGSVIHAIGDEQDIRKIGGLVNFLPFTYTILLIGSLSLVAFPFLSGFYSKDLILELAYGQYLFTGHLAYWLGTISASFTAFYSLRLLALTFYTYPNGSKVQYINVHEAPMTIAIPILVLAVLSITFGYLTKDIFVGIGSDFLINSIFTHPNHQFLVEAEFAIPLIIKFLPLIGSFFGIFIAIILYQICPHLSLMNNKVLLNFYRFFNKAYSFDNLYSKYIIYPTLNLGNITDKILDKGVIEIIGPYGLVIKIQETSQRITKYDTGIIPHYSLIIFMGAILIISIVIVGLNSKILILILWIIYYMYTI